MKKTSNKGIRGGLKRPYNYHLYTTDAEYEFLARKSYGRESIREIIADRVFRPGWEKELETLRKQQRKAKIADQTFYHRKMLREKGLNFKAGRPFRGRELEAV